MSKSKQMEMHRMAVRLCEGGAVWFKGHSIRAKELHGFSDTCQECDMDSICDKEMSELCEYCEFYSGKYYCLELCAKHKVDIDDHRYSMGPV